MTAPPVGDVGDARPAPHRIRRLIKWIVYPILVINLSYYGIDDAIKAQHTLGDAFTVLDWMGAFAATLDDFAWIVLLLIYEIQTFWLPWDFKNRYVSALMILLKAACYGLIFQTSYSYIVALIDSYNMTSLAAIGDLCSMAGDGVSFLRNLEYTDVTPLNCATLTSSGELFRYPGEAVITDASGLAEDRFLRVVNIIENTSWLVILFLTEAAVQLQNRGRHEGAVFKWTNRVKDGAYLAIIGASIYWATKGHFMYAWDEFVWICGFAMLDMNLAEWRDDLEDCETLEEEADMLAAGETTAARRAADSGQ